MLQRIRHHLVFLLVILLPFHALFVTLGTKLIEGPGHAPLSSLAIWKEVLMALIFLIGIIEIAGVNGKKLFALVKGRPWNFHLDAPVWCILGLLFIAFLLIAGGEPPSFASFIFGFKYDFVPLIFFLLLAQLQWDEEFLHSRIFPALLIVGGIVSLYGIITLFFPQSFFSFLGYSDAHSLYAPGSSLSAFQQVSDTGIRRIQSTFSGPNQFGLWLLLPWSIGVVKLLKRFSSSEESAEADDESRSPSILLRIGFSTRSAPLRSLEENITLLLTASAIFLTFSRSAWIAAFIIVMVAMGMTQKRSALVTRYSLLVTGLLVSVLLIWFISPELLLRSISNRHHFERTREGIISIIQKPFGYGLGSAGPASNRVSDACLYFDDGADTSWAQDRSDFCLFVGNTQVQPTIDQKVCHCPLLPENWYVQIGIELGIFGFAIFLALTFFVLNRLLALRYTQTFLTFLGISIAAMFLHAWEDSAIAYTVWGLVGIVLSRRSAHRSLAQGIMGNRKWNNGG